MIRLVLTEGAYDVIATRLPKGSARWPMQRDREPSFIQVEAAVVDRMRPWADWARTKILRLIEIEAGQL